ncbi:MAG: hypothetical protein EBR91_08525 [Flavobacteriia bacterium]|jgi:hypothetical protein|nr:hypothetical protein [Flavobacteriia bacterium]NBV68390.1 hypothetical protein [Flavobacteriia bacterium]NBV92198.1 hypothetical protein [Flavobacteriia bacterium]NBY40694.1 hypothetical protein [Flavobacteriia bacterium]
MCNFIRSIICFCIVVLLVGCQNQNRKRLSFDNTEIPDASKYEKVFSDQDQYDSLVKKIDSSKEFKEVYSLEYGDKKGNRCMVTGLLNSKNSVVKLMLEESRTDGVNLVTDFYFSGKSMFFARQRVTDFNKDSMGFGEVFSYFGTNKKIIYSASKLANSEAELTDTKALYVKKVDFDPAKALSIINQKGPFETRFQGSIDTEAYTFIIVGTSGKNGQNSALAYNKNYPLAETMAKNESKYLNKKLRIDFTKVTEANNFSYQGLTGIKLIQE